MNGVRLFFVLIYLFLSACGGGDSPKESSFSGRIETPSELKQLLGEGNSYNDPINNLVALIQIGNTGEWLEAIDLPNDDFVFPKSLVDTTNFKYVYALRVDGYKSAGIDSDCPIALNEIPEGYLPLSMSSRDVNISSNTNIVFKFNSADCYPDSDGDGLSNIEELSYQVVPE